MHEAHINDENCVNMSFAITIFFNLIAVIKLLLKQSVNVDELDRTSFTSLQLFYNYYILSKIKRKLCIFNFFLKHKINLNRKISRENTLLIKIY